jgi:diguanylate cyclase (GGDEF)-like protein
MDTSGELDQVFGDYASLLRACLPALRGIQCYGPDGARIWPRDAGLPPAFTAACSASLPGLLKGPRTGSARVQGGGLAGYLVPLWNGENEPHGAVVLVLPAEAATLTAEACAELALPATRTLERELSLRVRLLESYRKLAVQAAEERLLHEVERTVQGPPDCEAMLRRILALCCHYLQVQSVGLLIPDKDLALVQGERFTRAGLQRLLEQDREDAADGSGDGDPDLLAVRIPGPRGRPVGVLALAGWRGPDFSARRRARLGRYLATHIESVLARSYDRLTGLAAWPAFEKLLATAAVTGDPAILMYFDIDQLNVANETLGREVGDQVLRALADILRNELAGHPVTRVSGDHFAAVLTGTERSAARAAAERVAESFSRLAFGSGERSYRASVSVGIGSMPSAAGEPVEGGVLATAQVACAAAKDRGRGRVEVYEPADLSIVQRFDDIQLVGFIRNAIERGRLALLGQPIVPVKGAGQDRRYFEVLVRMLDGDDRHISPSEFLSAAERYQLMEDLDSWVVANTLQVLARSREGLSPERTRLAINLSGQSLGSERFLGFVQQQLVASRVPPELICFEITETVAVANLQRAQTFMHTLRKSGCHFSLDDFGTGLSSFAYLKLFPVDTLKIDGSFIRDLRSNAVSQSVVAAIAEVARVMQLETVAEFVQDQPALDLLGKLGITWAQGYLLGEPAPLADCLGPARQWTIAAPSRHG